MLLTNASHHYPSIGWAVCKAHLISASPSAVLRDQRLYSQATPHLCLWIHIQSSICDTKRWQWAKTVHSDIATPSAEALPSTTPILLNPSPHSPGQRQARSLSALNRCSTERLSNLPGPKELENARCTLKAQHVLSHVWGFDSFWYYNPVANQQQEYDLPTIPR